MSDNTILTIKERVELIYSAALGANVLSNAQITNAKGTKDLINEYLLGDHGAVNDSLKQFIDDWQDSMFSDVKNYVSENDRTMSAFWQRVKDFFAAMYQQIHAGTRAIGKLLIGDLITAIKNLKAPYDQKAVHDALKMFVDNGILDNQAIAEFERIFGQKKLTQIALPIIASIGAVTELTKTIFNTAGADYGKKLLSVFTPNTPPSESLVRLGFLAPNISDTVRRKLAENGLSEEDQNLMFAAALNVLDIDIVRTLFMRNIISGGEVYSRMRQIGYTDDKTKLIMQTWEALPSIQDLVTMVDREAFDDSIISYYGYMEDSNLLPYGEFAKQGLKPYWVNKIWAAHWNTPSIQQGYEMLHRRVIGDKELDDLFKTVEIPPFWRIRLKAISYNPYTRVDVRRMYGMGVLKEQDVYENYLDLGYDHEHALKMTEFTIKYEQDEDQQLTRDQILNFYKTYLITENEARTMLQQVGYPTDRADYFIAYTDFQREQDYIETVVKNVGEQYVNGTMSLDIARGKLYEMNLPAKRVTTLFDTWNIQIYKNRKLPSKSDLDNFFKAGVIDIKTYESELLNLGYSARYIG